MTFDKKRIWIKVAMDGRDSDRNTVRAINHAVLHQTAKSAHLSDLEASEASWCVHVSGLSANPENSGYISGS